MDFQPHGKILIAGDWVETSDKFENSPAFGASTRFSVATPEHVDLAAAAAQDAFAPYSALTLDQRAQFLERIASEIEAQGSLLTEIGSRETGLPAARLEQERGRTCNQLKFFAAHIRSGEHLDKRHDVALPDRAPLPRPDLRMMQLPVGPVAVFCASNFPLAFSVAGGDTASALAAGCPVIVKGHAAHPGTAEIVAEAIRTAINECGLHPGVFSLIQTNMRATGTSIVQHPAIKAVGFTGSLAGGRALFDLCAARPEPIPFFGELGSVNPMFVLRHALSDRGEAIGRGWAASMTMGAGQFCTKPGLVIVKKSVDVEAFEAGVLAGLAEVPEQTMLTDGIASAFENGRIQMLEAGTETLRSVECRDRTAGPSLFKISARDWLADESLHEEVFGPLGLIIVADDETEAHLIASSLKGQLTCTLHVDENDCQEAKALVPVLANKAGRLLINGYSTGVEVAHSMVHGGPYPASTNFGATSVGSMSIRRFLRPVCFQNFPEELLPKELI